MEINSSLILEQTDEEHRGRVMGVYMMNFGLMPIGAIPLGFIASLLDVRIAFGLAGVALLLFAVAYTVFTDRIRNL